MTTASRGTEIVEDWIDDWIELDYACLSDRCIASLTSRIDAALEEAHQEGRDSKRREVEVVFCTLIDRLCDLRVFHTYRDELSALRELLALKRPTEGK